MNSGKTNFANNLSSELGAKIIHLDDYLIAEDVLPSYIQSLNYAKLKSDTNETKDCLLIIEGICLREVLATIQVDPNFLIYVKRISKNGIWHDEYHLDDYLTNQSESHEFHLSEMEYHVKQKPHETANLVFHRIEV